MAKVQTRKAVSIRGTTYARLREHCEVARVSMSDFVEQRIAEWFALDEDDRAASAHAGAEPTRPSKPQHMRPIVTPAAKPNPDAHPKRGTDDPARSGRGGKRGQPGPKRARGSEPW